jgi:uncharacterized protein
MRALISWLVFVATLVLSTTALAFTPPPITGHVTDTAGKLSDADHTEINRKLEEYRVRTTNEIAVLIPASLDGESIEDVGIATLRAWNLGAKGKDNGVLLVIAPVERRARIEVGKDVEGALTDLQSNDIIRQKVRPRLAPGRENYRAAIDDATDGIMAALDAGGAGASPKSGHPPPATPGAAALGLVFLLLVFLVPIILFIVIIRAIAGAFTSNGGSANRGWASGGTWSNDSNDSGWGGGGGGDFGGGGGGGDFGGGFSGGGGAGDGGGGGGGSSDSF